MRSRPHARQAFHGPDEEPMCKFTAQNDQVHTWFTRAHSCREPHYREPVR